jgi:hypothetical protein
MEPVRGVAVLVSPVEGSAARHVDQTGPIGRVAALDADGQVVGRMRLGPTQSYETGTPEA